MSPFEFNNTLIEIDQAVFRMHSITTPWGEDDPIVFQIRSGRFDERNTIAHWLYAIDRAPQYARVLDIGAFAGLFSLVSAARRPDLVSIAFEPSAITFGRLCYNIQLNGFNQRIVPVHLAASSQQEVIRLEHRYGIYTLCPGERVAGWAEPDHTETVLAIPLDQILQRPFPDFLNSRSLDVGDKPIAAMKIDVEGAERTVLEGSIGLIKTFRPTIICEALTSEAVKDLRAFFTAIQYRADHIEGERNLICLPMEKSANILSGFGEWKKANLAASNLYGTLQP